MGKAKVAVITGGERGIGRGIVERFARDGWHVGVLGIDTESAQSLSEVDRKIRFFHCDVASEAEVNESAAECIRVFEGVDALICNAGIASPGSQPIDSLGLSEWKRVLDVNLTGPFLCARAFARYLRNSNGSIVNIASTRASMSEPNTFAYSASKGGLVALTHSMAISLGPEIRVNAVSPGWIHCEDSSSLRPADHSQHPIGRVGIPEDIAGICAYLASPEASFVTGQNFVIDGGMTKKMIYEE